MEHNCDGDQRHQKLNTIVIVAFVNAICKCKNKALKTA